MTAPDTGSPAAAAGFGGRPASADRPRMRLVGWRPVETTGTLRGFAAVELPIGLTIADCPVHLGPRGPWAALPARPVLDQDGHHLADPARPGKRQWAAVLRWRNHDLGDRWSAAVCALVRAAHPKALP